MESAPIVLPTVPILPIHETCSIVSGINKGVLSDESISSAGDVHPCIKPCANNIKLAKIKEKFIVLIPSCR